MNNEEKARQLGQKYQTPCHGVGDCEFESYRSAIEMAEWKDKQFAKQGYTKEQLLNMGFGFTLNGDIVTPKEAAAMSEKYIYHVKQQLIDKAVEWMKKVVDDIESKYVWYDAEEGYCGLTEEFVEDFKKAMEE